MHRFVRSLALMLVLALCVGTLAGCAAPSATKPGTGGTSTANDTFTYAQGADPRGLDPALVDDGESSKIIVNIYEGLLKYATDSTKVEPSLAESWEISPDGLTYTFKLKQGVKFHDGTDFNADAVKFNIDRQIPPKVTADMSYAGFVYGSVKDVVVVDPYTVTINLTAEEHRVPGEPRHEPGRSDRQPQGAHRRQQQRHGDPRRHRPVQVRQVEQGRERRPRPQRRVLGREGQDQERHLPLHLRQLRSRSGPQQRRSRHDRRHRRHGRRQDHVRAATSCSRPPA